VDKKMATRIGTITAMKCREDLNLNIIFEKIYLRIDHFFSGDIGNVRNNNSYNVETNPEFTNISVEWTLNQKFSDIAARDLTILFNRITPYFFRKILIAINQFVLLYFLTDQELDNSNQSADKKRLVFSSFNHHFTYFIKPFHAKIINNNCYDKFSSSLEKMIGILFSLIKIKSGAFRNRPWRKHVSPLIGFNFNILDYKMAIPGASKLISDLLFHKRI
jgi:hypothetical protein